MRAAEQTPADRRVAELAAAQHGVVSRRQLINLGIGRGGIGRRKQAGRLHPVHREVYAVGHRRLTREGRWMAAVLTGGHGAVLSHGSAAALWMIRQRSGAPEVTLPRVRRAGDGVRYHRSVLAPDEVTVHDGIPVTTASRTILDLAAVLDRRQIERLLGEADYRRLWDAVALPELLARYPRRSGTRMLRAILGEATASTRISPTDLEERFLAFVESEGLPRPELHAALEIAPGRWVEPDCVWRAERLIVELDGRAAHATRSRFDSDRERDRALTVAGWIVTRVTWLHLRDRRHVLARDLRALFAQRGRGNGPAL